MSRRSCSLSPAARATASEVLNLAEAAPVRARFTFSDDDLDAIADWVREANIRWGFDRAHRHPYGVDFLQNTWRFGIDRVLAGVAMSDDSHAWLDTTLPLDDVSSNRVELAGRLAEYVDRLHTVSNPSPVHSLCVTGCTALSDGITSLTAVPRRRRCGSPARCEREFNDVLAKAGPHADTVCGCPTSRRCWTAISPAGRRARTSAPAR